MQPTTCPSCGATLPADAPEGLCPLCLLGGGAQTTMGRQSDPSVDALPAGTALRYVGDYELADEIARGGMGVVYRARQVSLNRTVAVKMILAGRLASEVEVQRFLTEAEAAANLQHPNIVAIHEVGKHGDQHYFSMDHVEGRDLGQLVADEGPLAADRAATLLETVARAVHFAHQRGTLHRDLKPGNVLVDADDVPYVTDFGLARPIDADHGLTESGQVLGSPAYMPPEQASGRRDELGPASDVYGLGAILYELLTGRPPFVAPALGKLLWQLQHAPPEAPSRHVPGVPRELETIVLKCLEKSPLRRYPSAAALADDLRRFLDRQPILARPVGRARRLASWCQRHPWTILALLSTALLAVIGLAYGLYEQNRYLVWAAENAGHTREIGPRTRAVMGLSGLGTLVFIVLLYAQLGLMLRQRGQPWRDLWDGGIDLTRPARPLPPTRLLVHGLMGLAGAGFALLLMARQIQAYVWEGSLSLKVLIGVAWPALYFGLAALISAIRVHQEALFGLQPEVEAALLARIEAARAATTQTIRWGWLALALGLQGIALYGVVRVLPEALQRPVVDFYLVGWLFVLPIPLAGLLRGWRRLLICLPFQLPLLVLLVIHGSGAVDRMTLAWLAGILGGLFTIRTAWPGPPKTATVAA